MPTITEDTAQKMPPKDKQVLEAVTEAVRGALQRHSPPTSEDLREHLPRFVQMVRSSVEDGDLTEEVANSIIRAYMAFLVEKEVGSSLEAVTSPPEEVNQPHSGFIASWAVSFGRAAF